MSESMQGRAARDIYLHNKYGSVLESRSPLRDADDNIQPEPCAACGELLRTHGEYTRHALRHVEEGTMYAALDPSFGMIVGLYSAEQWARFEKYDRMYQERPGAGREPHIKNQLRPEGLDAETNAVRPKCMSCGSAATGRGHHLDETVTDHEPVIAWAFKEEPETIPPLDREWHERRDV